MHRRTQTDRCEAWLVLRLAQGALSGDTVQTLFSHCLWQLKSYTLCSGFPSSTAVFHLFGILGQQNSWKLEATVILGYIKTVSFLHFNAVNCDQSVHKDIFSNATQVMATLIASPLLSQQLLDVKPWNVVQTFMIPEDGAFWRCLSPDSSRHATSRSIFLV